MQKEDIHVMTEERIDLYTCNLKNAKYCLQPPKTGREEAWPLTLSFYLFLELKENKFVLCNPGWGTLSH